MPARLADTVRVLNEDADTYTAALVSSVGEETTHDSGPLDHPYDIYRVGVRLLPDAPGDLPHVPEVLVTAWESDARLLADADPDARYGWIKDGVRPL